MWSPAPGEGLSCILNGDMHLCASTCGDLCALRRRYEREPKFGGKSRSELMNEFISEKCSLQLKRSPFLISA